jgi:hypothetical protein
MPTNPISEKLNEITFRKMSLEARIAEEESRLSKEKVDTNREEIIVDEDIDRLKTLKVIYSQFEDFLNFLRRNREYNS